LHPLAGRTHRAAAGCALLLAATLLLASQPGKASPGSTSGNVSLSNILEYGNTQYSVEYSYPSVAQVGSNLTITLTLTVVSQTGLVDFTTSYDLLVDVFVGNEPPLTGSINSNLTSPNLYQGARWGPNNVTIPLTAANIDLSKGQSANATVGITLEAGVYYDPPIDTAETQPAMQGQAGALVIQNGVHTIGSSVGAGAGQSYVTLTLVSSGVVLIVIAVLLPHRPKPPSSGEP
jgi:hypothetical protein